MYGNNFLLHKMIKVTIKVVHTEICAVYVLSVCVWPDHLPCDLSPDHLPCGMYDHIFFHVVCVSRSPYMWYV